QQQRSSTFPNKGLVVDTNPAPGNSADKGSTVTIYVGTGPNSVTLPNLKGKTVDEANQIIAGLHLPPATQTATNSTLPSGTVVRTNPGPGQVAPDTVVQLFVSSGQVKVPNVIGLDYNSAAAEIQN